MSNVSNRQQYIRRKQWKKDSRNYRKRKSLQQATETPEAEETRVGGSRGSPRIQSGRKAAKHTYSSLRYKLQSMIAKSLKQARKIENLRKENYRLKFKDKSKCSLSPATNVRKLIGRKKMSPDIRKNLLFNFAFMSGLEENKVFKKEKERRLFAKRVSNKIIKKYQMIGQLKNLASNKNYKKALETKKMHFKRSYKGVASAQEPEQPNVPGEGGDMNVDSFKQDNTVDGIGLPEISVDPENEKKNSEEAEDMNEVVGHDGIAEAPEPSKSEDNPEQKPDTSFIPGGKGKQEKPVPNVKDSVLENQAVPKAKSQDSTVASKSTSSTKTPSSPTQQKPGVQASNSNTEVKPVEETTEGESNDQNAKKQLQSDVTKYDEVNAGFELPQGSNTNVVTDEQTQDANANPLADRAVQGKKDTNILANGHPQDNSNISATQNIPVESENNIPSNEIPDETPEKGDQNSNIPNNNDLPHESANEKSPNDAAADLHNNEQNPSNLVNTIDQNKLQSTASNDDNLAKKTNSLITNSQTIKDTTRQQTVQEATQDKTSIARDETKVDQPQTNSVTRDVEETQDHTNMEAITHDLKITDAGTKNPSTDQKKPKVAQATEEFDNAIPDTTGTSIVIDEKPPEKSQKLKPTAVNPDGKSVIPSSLTETSTKTTVALEKMEGGSDLHQPPDEAADHYDLENTEGDEYSGPEFGDGGFGEVPKNKVPNPDVPSPITAAKEIITSQNERPMEFPSRNAFGQDSSSIRVISPFPEQEDSHFFFYFLSIVLILMAGYLIFHNKQKILDLIV
ncbi:hypothetical protein AVEN_80182-1 [Araneus ventricosus]|uniref:Uncharacterized protein n=1 Tax=Araneus ventricosus TaxID=182803 RepID=A0A4Y2QZ42_ARAVE|nr:hypothetical protein AVEN_80182-1 [Araneus ventricosus]